MREQEAEEEKDGERKAEDMDIEEDNVEQKLDELSKTDEVA